MQHEDPYEIRRSNVFNRAFMKKATAADIRRKVAEGADVNAYNDEWWDALIMAVRHNPRPQVIHELAKAGANFRETLEGYVSPLMGAFIKNNIKVCMAIAETHPDVNRRSGLFSSRTPLMEAVSCSHAVLGQYTRLYGGEKVRYIDVVRERGSIHVVRILINRGAEVNARDWGGFSVLTLAAQYNINPDVVRLLIKHGADVHERNTKQGTALIGAALENPNPEIAQVLIENGAEVNVHNQTGFTPLMAAACNNANAAVTRKLLENGADINATEKDGFTAFMVAAKYGTNRKALAILREHGADINVTAKNGNKAAYYLNKNPHLKGFLEE